jgi:hypothetical protein
VALPKTASSASWQYDHLGDDGTLTLDLKNPPGATTALDALWTSKDLRAYNAFTLLNYKATTTHTGVPTAGLPASFSWGFRYRPAGGRWSAWQDASASYTAGTPGSYRLASSIVFYRVPAKRVQLQMRLHVEITDAAQETQSWQLQAI